ncbi:hypothetical protein [Nevskia sp.]|uniref:hypothetical protein n=1 Tax=Nevskia sp. TaxID=1929292 RepID=UPI0025D15165|nr:hypothetical protein [Nevskia sp.]
MRRPMHTIAAVLTIASLLAPPSAVARDTRLQLPIADATTSAGNRLGNAVKLFWGPQAYPEVEHRFATVTANKKTNFFNKSDKEGCEWAWLSAVLALQERAVREGGNAVVEITSVYRGGVLSSEREYECGAGSVIGGVALQGTIVKLK